MDRWPGRVQVKRGTSTQAAFMPWYRRSASIARIAGETRDLAFDVSLRPDAMVATHQR